MRRLNRRFREVKESEVDRLVSFQESQLSKPMLNLNLTHLIKDSTEWRRGDSDA
jgi:hypothetical protein